MYSGHVCLSACLTCVRLGLLQQLWRSSSSSFRRRQQHGAEAGASGSSDGGVLVWASTYNMGGIKDLAQLGPPDCWAADWVPLGYDLYW